MSRQKNVVYIQSSKLKNWAQLRMNQKKKTEIIFPKPPSGPLPHVFSTDTRGTCTNNRGREIICQTNLISFIHLNLRVCLNGTNTPQTIVS